ncbi:MAG: transglutaminase-like cysteine peptidase [Hyphomicrobiales bacterium]
MVSTAKISHAADYINKYKDKPQVTAAKSRDVDTPRIGLISFNGMEDYAVSDEITGPREAVENVSYVANGAQMSMAGNQPMIVAQPNVQQQVLMPVQNGMAGGAGYQVMQGFQNQVLVPVQNGLGQQVILSQPTSYQLVQTPQGQVLVPIQNNFGQQVIMTQQGGFVTMQGYQTPVTLQVQNGLGQQMLVPQQQMMLAPSGAGQLQQPATTNSYGPVDANARQHYSPVFNDGRELPSASEENAGNDKAQREARREVPVVEPAPYLAMVRDVASKKGDTPAMEVTGSTSAPIGFVQFCKSHSSDCDARTSKPGIVRLSRSLWNELVAVNAYANAAVEPVTDMDLYHVAELWTYPDNGRGDCEDYVLLKQRLLLERGWPASALLITVVRDQRGDGHAVLTVRTDEGDFVLDNQEAEVLPWYGTEYRYIKRQSERNAKLWVSVDDPRPYRVGSR